RSTGHSGGRGGVGAGSWLRSRSLAGYGSTDPLPAGGTDQKAERGGAVGEHEVDRRGAATAAGDGERCLLRLEAGGEALAQQCFFVVLPGWLMPELLHVHDASSPSVLRPRRSPPGGRNDLVEWRSRSAGLGTGQGRPEVVSKRPRS